MDPALKQRLIGAAVLVALAVIFLPMLIGRPAPAPAAGNDVPLDIPAAPDRPMQTREIPLTLPPAGSTPTSPEDGAIAAQDDPDRVVAVDVATAPRADALDPPPAAADGDTPPAAPDTTPAAAAVVDVAATPPATTEPAATVVTTEPPAAASATPTTDSPPTTATRAAAPVAGTRYVVNLGTYANRDNAAALATRLRGAGLPVLSESLALDGKPATRVRLGPYAGRGDAEAARLSATRLQSDLPATVVALADSETTPAVRPSAVGTAFAVQLGALKDEAEANALRDRVRKAGFAGYTERTQTDAGTLWRVRAGPELSRERAERLRDELRGKLALDGIVVGHP